MYYYINTNEIPSELSHENLISSHVKITCYLHMWKYHHCYDFIINRTFQTKKLFKQNGLAFHWCLFIRVEKYFTSECSERVKYFSALKEKFHISARPCNILYFYFFGDWNTCPGDRKWNLRSQLAPRFFSESQALH